jgi:hypothetical protein
MLPLQQKKSCFVVAVGEFSAAGTIRLIRRIRVPTLYLDVSRYGREHGAREIHFSLR